MIKLDGIPIRLQNPDLDGDGIVGGVETITRGGMEGDVTYMQQPTEVGDAMKSLDSDIVDPSTKHSSIDQNTVFSNIEKMSHLVVDSLVTHSFLPLHNRDMSRLSKRLSVSVNGIGRRQKVEVATGIMNKNKENGSLIDKAKQFFGGDKK